MKKWLSQCLAAILVLSLLCGTLSACGAPTVDSYEHIRRELAAEQVYDKSDATVVEGPENGVAKTIQYIDMDLDTNQNLFMMVSLQGNVNRSQASMYVIHGEMVEGTLNASRYWFEKIPETYTGEDAFEWREYTDPYAMLVANRDAIKGCVLYHERLVDAANTSRIDYPSRYADMAVLNLTVMMCGQYEAVALTYGQYNRLRDEYGLTLDILGDTTAFMKKSQDGSVDDDRGDREVWMRTYLYALDAFGDSVSENALVHNPGFQAATFDYAIAHKLFVYNRIFSGAATEAERKLELAVLNRTKPNTPVLGVWYLQADEGTFVPLVTENYKFFLVSYESFNWSWSTGLPREEMSNVHEEKLTLDPTKNYVSFTFSEGDNNSYVHMQMPTMFESPDRGEVPIGWTMAPTVWETNPNIIRYFNANWAEGDGLAIPEAGVDYVYHTPPKASRGEFFALSDEYFGRVGSGSMRMLADDLIDPLPYATAMKNLDSVMAGYYDTDFSAVNNDDADSFLFRNVLFIKNLKGADAAETLKSVQGSGPFFYSVSLMGWGQTPATAKGIMEDIGDNFVAVTPSQLADLYRQYYARQFEDVAQAEFDAGMTREEMGFLWRASDYSAVEQENGVRYATGKDYFVYKFDLADAVTTADLAVRVSGNYQVEVSSDDCNWYVVGKGSAESETVLELDAGIFLQPGQPLYVRVGTRDLKEGNLAKCHGLSLRTDLAADGMTSVAGGNDHQVYVSGGERTETGRKGEFVYRFRLAEGITSGDLALRSEGGVTAELSTDNKSYTALPLAKVGNLYAAPVAASGLFYLKIKAEQPVTALKFTPEQEAVKQLSFSPVNSKVTDRYLLSVDESKQANGISSYRRIDGKDAMLYKFRVAEGINTTKLRLDIFGLYKLEISNDGKTFTTLREVTAGEDSGELYEADIADWAKPGRAVYLRVSLSSDLRGKIVRVAKVRFLTNLTDEWLLNKVDRDREADASVTVASTKTGAEWGEEDEKSPEYLLIDSSSKSKIYLRNNSSSSAYRTVEDGGYVVYKFSLRGEGSADFYRLIGLESAPSEVTRFRLMVRAMNGFRLEISADGKTWSEGYDVNDAAAQNGANEKYYEVKYPEELLASDAVYLKFCLTKAFVPDKTHTGMLGEIQFFIN